MLAITCLAVITLLILYQWTKKRYRGFKLAPSVPGLPFIGVAFKFDIERPHESLTQWAQQYGSIFRIKIFGKEVVVVNSYETITQTMITQANQFAGRPEVYRMRAMVSHAQDLITISFTARWVYRKKLTMQFLKMYGDNLETLEKISMEYISDMLEELENISDSGPYDIYPLYQDCVTGIISSIMFGQKMEVDTVRDIQKSIQESMTLIQPTGPYVVLDMIPLSRYIPNRLHKKLLACAATVKSIVNAEINKRRNEAEADHPMCLIDAMLDHQRQEPELGLTDDEIYGISSNLFVAGVFTTATTLNALMACLINKPEIQDKMAAEIRSQIGSRQPCLEDRKHLHYVEAAILEILRYSSITSINIPHLVLEDSTINGYDVPKGTEILMNLWNLHHSEDYWRSPWDFIPERFLDDKGQVVPPDHINRKRLLAFGASRRVCVGETLAKNRLFLMVTSLLQRFEFKPASQTELPRHDARDYKSSIGVEPHKFRLRVILRK